jgi:hypothetical protein
VQQAAQQNMAPATPATLAAAAAPAPSTSQDTTPEQVTSPVTTRSGLRFGQKRSKRARRKRKQPQLPFVRDPAQPAQSAALTPAAGAVVKVVKVTSCMLCTWTAWNSQATTNSTVLQRQLSGAEYHIKDAFQSGSATKLEAWKSACYDQYVEWVDENEDATDSFLLYFTLYSSSIADTLLVTTFIWAKASPLAKHCFMAERELNLPPYTLWHPYFTSTVVPSAKTCHVLGRAHGAPVHMDARATFIAWIDARDESMADNGLTARITLPAPRRASSPDDEDSKSSTSISTDTSSSSSTNSSSTAAAIEIDKDDVAAENPIGDGEKQELGTSDDDDDVQDDDCHWAGSESD